LIVLYERSNFEIDSFWPPITGIFFSIMAQLSNRDLKDVLYLTHAALTCSTIDELREKVLYCLEQIFECDKSAFWLTQEMQKWEDSRQAVVHGIDRLFLIQYDQRYRELDPYFHIEFPFLPPVTTPEEIAASGNLLVSEYYNDFLKPQSIRYMLNLFLKSDKGLLGGVGLFRPSYAGSFTARDKAKAELVVSYLVEILEEKMVSSHLRHCTEIFESVALGRDQMGIILLNEFLDPIYMSDTVYALIASLCRKEHTHKKLQCPLPQEIYYNCEELKQHLHDQDYCNQQRQFNFDSGKESQKFLILIRLFMHQRKPFFLVGFMRGDPGASMINRLIEIGLSQREAEVARLIFEGLELADLCNRLCVSPYTIKAHLRAIYEKLGVHTRTGLVHRLIGLN
jgi:DNA-binding CsgD family transcriptional regulator